MDLCFSGIAVRQEENQKKENKSLHLFLMISSFMSSKVPSSSSGQI